MKIQDIWKEKLQNDGIDFHYSPSGKKYPYVASISFSDGNSISMRGKKSGDVLYLLSNDVHELRKCDRPQLNHFAYLFDFFKEFAKEKEAKTIFVNRDPFSFTNLAENLIPKDEGFYLDNAMANDLKNMGLFIGNLNGWILRKEECPISLLLETQTRLREYLLEKDREDALFSFKDKLQLLMNPLEKYAFHYYGLNSSISYRVSEGKLTIGVDKLSIRESCTLENFESALDSFFAKLKKQLKVKSVFSESTYFLERYLSFISVPYGMSARLKETLLKHYSPHILEEACANALQNEEKISLIEKSYYFFRVADHFFVCNYSGILFYADKSQKEQAFQFFHEKIIGEMQREMDAKKEKLKKFNEEYLKNL